jgi:glycosyltransferase involved in cell wall biosynthesis
MRIALVHYSIPPVIGGVERILAEQGRLLRRHGHEVDFFVSAEDALVDYDVVLLHNVLTMPFNLPLTARLHELIALPSKARWINWVHDVAKVNPHYAHLPWHEPEMQRLHQMPTKAKNVTVSEVRRQELAEATGLSLESIQVFPNGIDATAILGLTQHTAQLAEELELWSKHLLLLHPTRLVKRKNIELALQIIAVLKAQHVDVAYLVTGAPDPHNSDHRAYARQLKELSAELGITDHVHFLGERGPLREADVRSLYALSDAVIFPSTAEGFGLPLLEGALHGLRVFCSGIPAHLEVAVGASFFSLTDSPADIAQKIQSDPITQHRRLRREIYAAHDWSQLWPHLQGLLGG